MQELGRSSVLLCGMNYLSGFGHTVSMYFRFNINTGQISNLGGVEMD